MKLLGLFLVMLLIPSAGTATELDLDRFMPVSEIRRGMVGEGITAFQGQELVRFGVEIRAVFRGNQPRGDLILARLSGPVLDETGNMSGMSGSPIYLDGRLAGAVAYAYPFSLEPIAGITPIGEMLELWELPEEPVGIQPPRIELGTSLRTIPELARALGIGPPGFPDRARSTAVPIPLALSAPGGIAELLSRAATGAAGSWSGGLPSLVVGAAPEGAAGSERSLDATAEALRPGSPVAVMLADGDVRVGATGTLTHRDGDRVLAFGHSAFSEGRGRYPFATAQVHMVMPNSRLSYKFSSPLEPVGSVIQDRRPGTAARLGPIPRMIPFRVTLQRGRREEFSFRVLNHPSLTPWLLVALLGNSLERTSAGYGDTLYRSRLQARFAGADPGIWRDVVHTAAGPFNAAATTMEPISTLFGAAREPVQLRELVLHLEMEPGNRSYELQGASVDRTRVHPGETLGVRLRLRAFGREAETRTVRLRVPQDLRPGSYNLRVLDRPASHRYELWRSPSTGEDRTVSAVLDLLSRLCPGDELRILISRRGGLSIHGHELPGVPARLRALLGRDNQEGNVEDVAEAPVLEEILRLPAQVRGTATLKIEVIQG